MQYLKVGILMLFSLFLCDYSFAGSSVWITDVQISPLCPDEMTPIVITSSGYTGIQPSYFDHAVFSRDGLSLQLDLIFDIADIGVFVVLPWSHAEDIGLLPQGNYNLWIKAYDGDHPETYSCYETTMSVIPEPASVSFLIGGMSLLARRYRPRREAGRREAADKHKRRW